VNYEIRAMSFAEILDTGFRLVRDHFALLTGIGLVLYVPLAIAQELLGASTPQEVNLQATLAALVIALLVVALSPIAQGAMTLAIGAAYRGQSTTLAGVYRVSLRRALALTGTFLLVALGILVGMVLLVIPGLYLMVAWSLAIQVVMLEGIAGSSALSRSRNLLRDHMWRAV
jgi:hypothetical protein